MTRSAGGIPHFMDEWAQVARRIRQSAQVAVFLDFDGTLAPLAPTPDKASVPGEARRALRRLARRPRATVVVLSGRRRADVARRVGIPGILYWGLYGWENGRKFAIPGPAQRALGWVRAQLALRLRPYDGKAWIENKRVSLTVHLRDVTPRLRPRVRREVESVLRFLRRDLDVVENLRDAEIVPRQASSKGEAVRKFLAQERFREALPIYFGDDLSDESAFAAVQRGIPVLVGAARRTRAKYRLCCAGEVARALEKLGAELP